MDAYELQENNQNIQYVKTLGNVKFFIGKFAASCMQSKFNIRAT
jgi:hypothetical protein